MRGLRTALAHACRSFYPTDSSIVLPVFHARAESGSALVLESVPEMEVSMARKAPRQCIKVND